MICLSRPSVACSHLLESYIVQFSRCRLLTFFKVRVKHLIAQALQSDLGGDNRARTDDPLLAKQVLSQLSYTPIFSSPVLKVVGPSGLEPPTSRLSVVRSSQLSYGPVPLALVCAL